MLFSVLVFLDIFLHVVKLAVPSVDFSVGSLALVVLCLFSVSRLRRAASSYTQDAQTRLNHVATTDVFQLLRSPLILSS